VIHVTEIELRALERAWEKKRGIVDRAVAAVEAKPNARTFRRLTTAVAEHDVARARHRVYLNKYLMLIN
jgi:hypothetical protein